MSQYVSAEMSVCALISSSFFLLARKWAKAQIIGLGFDRGLEPLCLSVKFVLLPVRRGPVGCSWCPHSGCVTSVGLLGLGGQRQ